VRIKAAFTATTVAEHFRDQGRDVMLMMDSVTRFAMAQREVGLAIGEPPATRGYTPSVFAMLPKLLERSGTSPAGSITALYTVLVDGDDMNEPIADAVRGILDGHIVLSRQLAHAGHYPAVDVLSSVSRLVGEIVTPATRAHGNEVRKLMATYKEKADLISIGAYQPGSDPQIDAARRIPAPGCHRAEQRRGGRRLPRPARDARRRCRGRPRRRGRGRLGRERRDAAPQRHPAAAHPVVAPAQQHQPWTRAPRPKRWRTALTAAVRARSEARTTSQWSAAGQAARTQRPSGDQARSRRRPGAVRSTSPCIRIRVWPSA
jgi:hypothetical protein